MSGPSYQPLPQPQPERVRQRRDPELTLSWGMLTAIFFGLVLICGLCFGLGYSVGHHSSQQPAAAAQPVDNAQPASQASASAAKPSANKQTPTASVAPDAGDGQAGDPSTSTLADTQAAASSSQAVAASGPSAGSSSNGSPQVAPAQGTPAQVRPVAPTVTNPQPVTGFTPGVRVQPALPQPAASYMVQIAAVSHTEDAAVLVNALRKRGYTVTAQRKPEDGMIHVWIGPFSTRDEANRWKVKLLDDGYNAVVQP
jgi:cell division septation protein DedD